MNHSNKELDFLEEGIPALAQAAVTIARHEALSSGLSVLEVEEGNIVEVFPDGSKRIIKPIERGVALPKGTRLMLCDS